MKVSETFKVLIEQHLQGAASMNELFAKKLANPKKNIDDCITYILNQVKSSGVNGFEKTEIYGMAMHYYDEEDVKPGSKCNVQIVVDQRIELTEEEVEEAKKKAKEQVLAEEIAKIRKKPAKPKAAETKTDDNTLF